MIRRSLFRGNTKVWQRSSRRSEDGQGTFYATNSHQRDPTFPYSRTVINTTDDYFCRRLLKQNLKQQYFGRIYKKNQNKFSFPMTSCRQRDHCFSTTYRTVTQPAGMSYWHLSIVYVYRHVLLAD